MINYFYAVEFLVDSAVYCEILAIQQQYWRAYILRPSYPAS